MDLPDHELPSRPLSVKELKLKAEEYEWNDKIPFKYWVRAADHIYREALNYKREGNFSNAYMFYLRHVSLVFDHLNKHPEAKEHESKAALRPLLKRMPSVMRQMEELKPYVEKAHEEWVKVKAAQRESQAAGRTLSHYQKHAAADPALSWNTASQARILDAGEHQKLAVDLATREIRRRDAARRATRQAGISDEVEQERRGAGLWDDWDAGSILNSVAGPRFPEEQDLQKYMQATRQMTSPGSDRGTSDERPQGWRSNQRPISSQSYQYPSISKSRPIQYDSPSLIPSREPGRAPPPRPSKEALSPPPYEPTPPAVPRKEILPPSYSAHNRSPSPETIPELPAKTPNVLANKERITFKPSAYLENGKPIRPVFLPDKLRKAFLEIASDNTRQGLEMCGILCGTPVNNALFITCLLIPEQKCTSDTCETENESAMLDYCIEKDLLVVGWIHTHPTQTCFMSSRDMHTQAGYQVMMPESIAIVCAPRYTPSWGIFRLTDPPGLPHVLHCNHTDTFHQHSIDNIYTDAGAPPGHVYETSHMPFDVHDLRPKR